MRAATIDEFLADRFGRYVCGAHYLVWCVDRTLGGVVFWGTPDETDIEALVRLLSVEVRAGSDLPYDLVVDGGRLASVTPSVFEKFASFASGRMRDQASLIRRHAMVAPSGLVGTIMAGFLPLFGHHHKWQLFTDVEAAFAWLDRREVLEAVVRLVEDASDTTPLVRALHVHLRQHLRDSSIERAARSLGRSGRSLQRELQRAGTSFRRELESARIEAAKKLLRETDAKVDALAALVGFRSGGAFARRFRKRTGEAPTRYRERLSG